MRLLAVGLLTLAAAAALPAAAGATAPPALGPGARVFTLAGGGNEEAREGLPAHRADLSGPTDIAPLPDGSVAFTLVGSIWRVGPDGLIHDVPDPDIYTDQIAARPDGTLLASTGKRIRSLAPGAAEWDAGFPLRRLPLVNALLGPTDLVPLPDGFAVLSDRHVYTVRNGIVRTVRLPGRFVDGRALTALPDGRLMVAYDLDGRRLGLIGADGTFSSIRASAASAEGLATLPDGNVLAAGETLRAIDPAGVDQAVAGAAPGLGNGDGGPPASALFDASSAAARPDGTLVFRDTGSRGLARSAFDDGADLLPGGGLRTNWLYGVGGAIQDLIRVAVPAGVATPWALAAIAPATYETIGAGRVAIATTVAGHAVLTVTRDGREAGRAEADLAAGGGELTLPSAPPRGDLRLKLVLRAADGRTATAYTTATTLTRLTKARARPLAANLARVFTVIDEARMRRGGCVRQSPQQIACRLVHRGRCRHVVTTLLRADGARVYPEGRRACRSVR